MPDVALTPAEVADVTLALMSLRTPGVPAAFVRGEATPASTRSMQPQGEVGALFERYRCLSCHTLGGVGGTLANVPLDREGSKVQPAWLEAFLQEPDTLRVAQEERMPKLGITADEAATLTRFLTMVMRDDRIPLEPPARPPRTIGLDTPELVDAGRAAFDALGCRACHIEGERGGYVGPDLFRSGVRLRSGWVYALLTDPALMAPELAHPGEPLDPATATALTAFLQTLTPATATAARPEEGAP
jgi:cytochrome c2